MRASSFKEFISEGINDKGIFKAIFMAGTPGAGKSYVLSKISGGVSPRIVNTDKFYEFVSKIHGLKMDKSVSWVKDQSKMLTKNQLELYLNSMLPLFIDGTSSNINNVVLRAGILESLGYDVGMVFVNTDLETSLKRARERERVVPDEFIKKVYETASENKEFYESKFSFFVEVKNNDGELTDEAVQKAYKKVEGFFNSPLKNPIGRRNLEKISSAKEKYLAPTIFSDADIGKKLDAWYRT